MSNDLIFIKIKNDTIKIDQSIDKSLSYLRLVKISNDTVAKNTDPQGNEVLVAIG